MTSAARRYVLWVTRTDTAPLQDAALRERAGVEDTGVEVRTEALSEWGLVAIPAGSRDEWGTVYSDVLNVGSNQLPPEGRVFVVVGDDGLAAE